MKEFLAHAVTFAIGIAVCIAVMYFGYDYSFSDMLTRTPKKGSEFFAIIVPGAITACLLIRPMGYLFVGKPSKTEPSDVS